MVSWDNGRIQICKEILAPPETVWNILTDTQLWSAWGPSLCDVDCNDRYIQAASSGRVKTLIGLWLPFTITSFRQMEFWNWKIGPVKATGHRLINKRTTSCTLCFDMAWWAAGYIPICWLALRRIDRIVSTKRNN